MVWWTTQCFHTLMRFAVKRGRYWLSYSGVLSGMGKIILQKIFESHSPSMADVDDIIDVSIDVRVARDFGGANVVKHLEEKNLPLDDPKNVFYV